MGKNKLLLEETLPGIQRIMNDLKSLQNQKSVVKDKITSNTAKIKKLQSYGLKPDAPAIKNVTNQITKDKTYLSQLQDRITTLTQKIKATVQDPSFVAKIKAGAKGAAQGVVKAAKAHPKTALAIGGGAALGAALLAAKGRSNRENVVMKDTNLLVDQYLDVLQEETNFKEKVKGKLATEGVGFIAAVVGGPYLIKGAIQAYKNMFDKVHQKCKGLPQEDYNFCMQKAKAVAFNAELAKLKQGLSQCSKAKDPEKCKQQLQNKIANTQFKMKVLKNSIRDALARRKAPRQEWGLFSEAEGMEGLPKGWTQKSVKKFAKSLTGKGATKKDFFEKCVSKMKGKVSNPQAFCASVKDEVHGSTFWRGKGKSEEEAAAAARRKQNVKQD